MILVDLPYSKAAALGFAGACPQQLCYIYVNTPGRTTAGTADPKDLAPPPQQAAPAAALGPPRSAQASQPTAEELEIGRVRSIGTRILSMNPALSQHIKELLPAQTTAFGRQLRIVAGGYHCCLH
jgi:hypothetical protein